MRGRGQQGAASTSDVARLRMVHLVVTDDGPGLAPEARTRLFEAFFTTKGPDEGTGLGLAISRGIAREHGGDLVLEDRPTAEPGAQLRPPPPARRPPPIARGRPAERVIPEGVPARVLVVDDEAAVRDALVAQLGRLGAQRRRGRRDPRRGRAPARSGAPYDAILLDVRLPGRTGLEIHRALREVHPDLAGRVVFMTGDLVNDDVIRAVRATGTSAPREAVHADELRVGARRPARAAT